ncbi:hypothetical protein [Sphingobacterium suaedae]|uniref:Crp/Fnr family transcriptional regulator n=1 Tax=Sphingobacterium suaedae TaxID=1686402 RepID=A0ABW5KJ45_9SPHI
MIFILFVATQIAIFDEYQHRMSANLMTKENIQRILANYKTPSIDLVDLLAPYIQFRQYKRKDVLLPYGSSTRTLRFIFQGNVVAFGSDKTIQSLWTKDEFIIFPDTILTGAPSDVQIMCATPTDTYEIDLRRLQHLRRRFREVEVFCDLFLTHELRRRSSYLNWLKCTSRAKRVEDFAQHYRELNNVLTDQQKAEYMDMSLRWFQKLKNP